VFGQTGGLATVDRASGYRSGHQRTEGRQVEPGAANRPAPELPAGGDAQDHPQCRGIERIDAATAGPPSRTSSGQRPDTTAPAPASRV
jgi:hypothetical protein